jgi:ribosome-binding factor A
MVTVTRVQMSEDGKRAVVYITVFPEDGERTALAFANRNRGDVGRFLSKRTKGMRIPQFMFEIDMGDKNRRRMDELSE